MRLLPGKQKALVRSGRRRASVVPPVFRSPCDRHFVLSGNGLIPDWLCHRSAPERIPAGSLAIDSQSRSIVPVERPCGTALLLGLALLRFRLQLIFLHQVNVVTEDLRVVDRHLREDLAVEPDVRLAQRRHQAAVGNTGLARGGVDAGDPQGAELALARATIAIGVRQRVDRGLAGRADELALRATAALGLAEELLVLLVRGNAALHS